MTRTTSTTLDVTLERRIDDYWNVEGDQDLSDAWTRFTRFTILDEEPPDGRVYMVREAADKEANNIQARSLAARNMKKCQKQLNAKKKWAIEKPKLENARRLLGVYFIDPADEEFKETV